MDSETRVFAVYEWLCSTIYIPNELFDVVLRDIAIMLIGFEFSLKMPGLADALVSTPSNGIMRGGVTDAELAALRQAAEANGASQNARNSYRNAQLRYNTERQVAQIRGRRPANEQLALPVAVPIPDEPRLPEDLEQFLRRINELRVARRRIEAEVVSARGAMEALNAVVNNATVSEMYQTAGENLERELELDRLEKINNTLRRVRQELGQLSELSISRLIKSSVFSAAGTALAFGGLTAAGTAITGAALLGATGVGLATVAAGAAAAAVADNPATVQRAANGVLSFLTGVVDNIGQTLLTSQHVEDYGELPDLVTPAVQAASRLASRPYGGTAGTFNLTAPPTGYNEDGTPIYNFFRPAQPGMPYYDPSALVLTQDDPHPLSTLLAYPVRIAATTIFVGGTNIIYQTFKDRDEISLRGQEAALQRNINASTATLRRLIDTVRARHNDARALARAEFERQRTRLDEQERIITEAYAEFVRQRTVRVEAFQALMQRWYESRQAAVIAQQAANAQVNFAEAMMALARRGHAAIEAPREPALLVLNQAAPPAPPPANAPGEQLNEEVREGGRRRKTRGRNRKNRKSRKLRR